eukprot:2580906-Pleurochrysis_carterae.AAC.1
MVAEGSIAVVDEGHQREQYAARSQAVWQVAACLSCPSASAADCSSAVSHGVPQVRRTCVRRRL